MCPGLRLHASIMIQSLGGYNVPTSTPGREDRLAIVRVVPGDLIVNMNGSTSAQL